MPVYNPPTSSGPGGGAPTDATYVTQTSNATLSAEQALSGLTTGVVKVTNGTGALSTAVGADLPTHAHAQTDVTNLTTDLSAKAPTTRAINTAAPLSGGGDLSADRTLTTSMATNKLVGRGTGGTGVMEEITLGTNLSLSGTTLNATGGSGLTQGQTAAISAGMASI